MTIKILAEKKMESENISAFSLFVARIKFKRDRQIDLTM